MLGRHALQRAFVVAPGAVERAPHLGRFIREPLDVRIRCRSSVLESPMNFAMLYLEGAQLFLACVERLLKRVALLHQLLAAGLHFGEPTLERTSLIGQPDLELRHVLVRAGTECLHLFAERPFGLQSRRTSLGQGAFQGVARVKRSGESRFEVRLALCRSFPFAVSALLQVRDRANGIAQLQLERIARCLGIGKLRGQPGFRLRQTLDFGGGDGVTLLRLVDVARRVDELVRQSVAIGLDLDESRREVRSAFRQAIDIGHGRLTGIPDFLERDLGIGELLSETVAGCGDLRQLAIERRLPFRAGERRAPLRFLERRFSGGQAALGIRAPCRRILEA
jgi:hypothetical protein